MTLTTTKNPSSLKGRYILNNMIDLEGLVGPTQIFAGNAIEAVGLPCQCECCRHSLPCVGKKDVQVKVIADPNIRVNRHEIEVEGDFGRFLPLWRMSPHHAIPKPAIWLRSQLYPH